MESESRCVWEIHLRSDDLGFTRFKQTWDSLTDSEMVELFEHLDIAQALGADLDCAHAVLTEGRATIIACLERTQRHRCILFLAVCAEQHRIIVLDVCRDDGLGNFALTQRLVREARTALGLINPAVEYL